MPSAIFTTAQDSTGAICHTADAGICWPSITGKRPLTAKTPLSERTIQNADKSLCSKGQAQARRPAQRRAVQRLGIATGDRAGVPPACRPRRWR